MLGEVLGVQLGCVQVVGVRVVGLEPTRSIGSGDFKSPASTIPPHPLAQRLSHDGQLQQCIGLEKTQVNRRAAEQRICTMARRPFGKSASRSGLVVQA